ncbi:hypothetical protein ACNHKD_10495 [Methylocystis sp. JAN1]|uniref:hypothetical protein n=1 Tax=Methylocystis sp. JAN1 TaxID=3397211 RepID=UPI003FA21197
MRLCARRFRGSLLIVALAFGGGAVAQELQLDPKALDTGGASSVQTKRGKSKRGADSATQQPGRPAAAPNGPNRQFGELEGWSPGKAPPKPKDKQDDSTSSSKPPVTVSPSGNMGTGFAF